MSQVCPAQTRGHAQALVVHTDGSAGLRTRTETHTNTCCQHTAQTLHKPTCHPVVTKS